MVNEKLSEYIKKCIETGKQDKEIIDNLLSVGWSREDIDDAILSVKENDYSLNNDVSEENNNIFTSSDSEEKINYPLEENNLSSNQQLGEDPFLESTEENQQDSFIRPTQNEIINEEVPEEEPVVSKDPIKNEFVDNSKKVLPKRIIIPIVITLCALFIFGVVFSFVQKIGPFSFLKTEETPEVVLENEEPLSQPEIIVEEPVVPEWICGEELIDERDGYNYSTFQIGDQCWMTENLNYIIEGSSCYDNDISNCEINGRLYNWSMASYACPSGWELPSDEDFKTLERYLGMDYSDTDKTGWRNVSLNAEGTLDLLNISLSGHKDASGKFKYLNEYANFWTSGEVDQIIARSFRSKDNSIYRGNASGEHSYSVRCIKAEL